MEIIQVTNYDVLGDEMPGRRYAIDEYINHIGNSRFSVLVDMYREAYDMSQIGDKYEECDKIIDRIVGVTCHKDVSIAVSKGRFLVKRNGEGDWKALDDENSNELVRQALSVSAAAAVEEELLEASLSEHISSDNIGYMSLASSTTEGLNDKKRGRRRSLLRRSASESTMLEDKKKTYRALAGPGADMERSNQRINPSTFRRFNSTNFQPTILEPGIPGSTSAPVIIKTSEQIKKHGGMDVVLSTTARMLSTKEKIVGNNRLKVMVALHKEQYKDMAPADQDKVAADLVKAVCHYWDGRILMDQGFTYAKLDPEQSLLAIKNLLSPEDAKAIIVSVAPAHTPSAKPLLSAPPVPEFLRNASMELLSTTGKTGNDPTDKQSMQSQAVKSLQARKAKRAMTKTLGSGRTVPEHVRLDLEPLEPLEETVSIGHSSDDIGL
jgi:hypothetical protein